MNSKIIKLLVFACAGLCLIIAVEWLYASYMQHRLLTSITSAKPQDYKADELPDINLTEQPEQSYVDLVARPLFIKGRKPVEEPRSEAEQATAGPENFDWQLTGVYGTKNTVSALFSRSKTQVAKDNHRKITLGDELDGWKLTEINTDRVVLKQGGNEKELLLRKPKSKTLAPRVNATIPVPIPGQVPTPVQAAEPVSVPIPEPATDTTEDTIEDTSESNQ